MLKINITTLGCPKNVVDSTHLTKSLISEGFVVVDNGKDADIFLVNTCGFIKDAKEESIEEILNLVETKKGSKKLVVFGCLAKRYRDELLKEIPEIDGIWGVGEEDKIITYCKSVSHPSSVVSQDKNKRLLTIDYRLPTVSYAYLKIADGCNKRCTFCVIPSIRGRFKSISRERILKEAEEYIQRGIRELILVGQDVTGYGKELRGYNLVSLLKDIVSIKGDFRIRLLYLYPTEIDNELIEFVAEEEKIQKYLDIPLQHSEDRILRLMGRSGTRNEYLKLISNIRRNIPQVALRTTFIVGFPGETEKDFKGLMDFIEDVRFDRLGVFKYSKEEETPSARLRGQIPEKVKNKRFDEIMSRQMQISLEKNRGLIGKIYKAIIDEVQDDVIIARLYSHAPEIDGVVIISNHSSLSLKVGDIASVEIEDAFEYDLRGRVVLHEPCKYLSREENAFSGKPQIAVF